MLILVRDIVFIKLHYIIVLTFLSFDSIYFQPGKTHKTVFGEIV